jgi:hypothetical protein
MSKIFEYLFQGATSTIPKSVDPVVLPASRTPNIAEYIFGMQGSFAVTGWGDITGTEGRVQATGQPEGAVIGAGVNIDVDPKLIPEATETDLHKFLRSGASGNYWAVPDTTGYTKDITIDDWENLSNTYYKLDIAHNLNTEYPQVELYQDGFLVFIDQVEVITVNLVRLYVLFSPDGRFNGSVSIIK